MKVKKDTGVRSGVSFFVARGSLATWAIAAIFVSFYGLGGFVDLMPGLMWHDQQRVMQLFALAAIGCAWLWSTVQAPRIARPTLPAWSVACLASAAALGVVSSMFSSFPVQAALEWSLLTSLGVGVLILADVRNQRPASFDRALLAAVFAVSAAMMLRFVGTYAAAFAAGGPLDTRELAGLGFSNRRFFGHFLTMALPLLAIPLLSDTGMDRRRMVWALVILFWAMAFTSATRGTFLGIGVATVLATFAGPLGRRFARVQAIGIAVGFCAYLAMFVALPQLASVDVVIENRLANMGSSSGRLDVWAHAVGLAALNPWLGVGPMHLAVESGVGHPAHPHNAVIQVAAEWGMPALLLILASVGCGLRRFERNVRASGSPVELGLLAALAGGLAQALVDGVIVMPSSQTMLMLVGGWAAGTLPNDRANNRAVTLRTPALAGAFALPLLIAGTIAGKDFPRVEARQHHYIATRQPYLHPRLWQQGLLAADLRPAPP